MGSSGVGGCPRDHLGSRPVGPSVHPVSFRLLAFALGAIGNDPG